MGGFVSRGMLSSGVMQVYLIGIFPNQVREVYECLILMIITSKIERLNI